MNDLATLKQECGCPEQCDGANMDMEMSAEEIESLRLSLSSPRSFFRLVNCRQQLPQQEHPQQEDPQQDQQEAQQQECGCPEQCDGANMDNMEMSAEEMEALRLSLSPPGAFFRFVNRRQQEQQQEHPQQEGLQQDQQEAQQQESEQCGANMDMETSAEEMAQGAFYRFVKQEHPQQEDPQQHQQEAQQEKLQHEAQHMIGQEQIDPPYPWSCGRRASVRSLEFLLTVNIRNIQGEVQCERCGVSQMASVDLESSFKLVHSYFMENGDKMQERAPKCWMRPRLLNCNVCTQLECLKPVIHHKKRSINWLFLFLTGTLGLCKLDQLKYFCKHNHLRRSRAKDRLLYVTYLHLLKQLDISYTYISEIL